MHELSDAMAIYSNSNTSETLCFENTNSSPTGDSFSSQSNEAEETFVLQLQESSQHLNSFPSIPNEEFHLAIQKTEFEEVEVFNAEKYFSDGVNEGINKDDTPEIASPQTKKQPRTPNVHCEWSWNSRRSFLHNERNQQNRKVNNTQGWNFLVRLGCNCSCKNKDSVKVDNCTSAGKAKEPLKNGNLINFKMSHSNNWLKEDKQSNRSDDAGRKLNTPDGISFPVLNSKTGFANKLHQQGQENDTQRKSLEVFGSPIMEKGNKSLSLERRITMPGRDAIPQGEVEMEIPASSNEKCNDTDSDASSDLFEIESFSTNANLDLARQASDGLSSCITPTCYGPSEPVQLMPR